MKSLTTKLTKFLATSALVFTACAEADTTGLTFGVGYRQDDLSWKLETPEAANPEAKSSLDFRDLEIVFVGAKIKGVYGCECPLYFRTTFDYGWVVDGTLRESDKFYLSETLAGLAPKDAITFDGGGVTNTSSFTQVTVHNDVSGRSHVWDFDIALGMPLDNCWFDCLTLIPTIGFNYDRSFLRVNDDQYITDGLTTLEQTLLGFDTDDIGSSSTYRTSWWGPWIGLDFVYCPQDCWNLYGEFGFHFLRVRRERETNTGFAYFDDYEKTKSGYGVSLKLGTTYVFCENWFFDASVAWLDYWSAYSRDSIYWNSANIRLDLGYMF